MDNGMERREGGNDASSVSKQNVRSQLSHKREIDRRKTDNGMWKMWKLGDCPSKIEPKTSELDFSK